METKFKFADPEAMLNRKAEDRRKFLELPPEEAQRLITIRLDGPPLNINEEDPIFTSDLDGDAFLD